MPELVSEVSLPRPRTVSEAIQSQKVLLCVALAGWVALFWPTLRGLVEYWGEDPDFSHGYLVPIISGLILWSNRARFAAAAARPSWLGGLALLLSVGVYFMGALSFTNLLQRVGAWASILSAVWLVLGIPALRAAPFPFFFLLLAIPPPYFVLAPFRLGLKGVATRLSAEVLSSMGFEAFPEGSLLVVGTQQLEVADACSGIRSLMAIATTAILFAYLFRAGLVKGALLLLAAVPVALLVNVLRILIVAIALSKYDIDWTHGTSHEVVGYLVFGASLVLLYLTWRLLEWFVRWKPSEVSK